jgi:hypothetical protein
MPRNNVQYVLASLLWAPGDGRQGSISQGGGRACSTAPFSPLLGVSLPVAGGVAAAPLGLDVGGAAPAVVVVATTALTLCKQQDRLSTGRFLVTAYSR